MKYIIMCGGEYKGWQTPRQLTELKGEALVARTIRLLKQCRVEDIAISASDERFEQFGVPVLHHENTYGKGGCWLEAFYPMEEPACYIFGDVVFSPAAITTIMKSVTTEIQFYASAPPFARNYIKPHAEPFAFKVVNQKRFRAAIDFCIANVDTGIFARHPISWELWQVINGNCVRQINYDTYKVINDYTCDIDKPEDIARLERFV